MTFVETFSEELPRSVTTGPNPTDWDVVQIACLFCLNLVAQEEVRQVLILAILAMLSIPMLKNVMTIMILKMMDVPLHSK